MKKKNLIFKKILFTAFITSAFIFCSVLGNTQSIAGTWKLTDAKETVTDKASGKTQDIGAQTKELLQHFQQILVFNADNTYKFSNSMVGAKKTMEVTGTYTISANQLKLNEGKSNLPKVDSKYSTPSSNSLPPVATIVSHSSNTLVLHYSGQSTDDGKTFIVNIEDTFTKQ